MLGLRKVAAVTLSGALLAGCTLGAQPETFADPIAISPDTVEQIGISRVLVRVPESLDLTVEPERLFPAGGEGIVWHPEIDGLPIEDEDRVADAVRIVEEAVSTALEPYQGPQSTSAVVNILRFHAITPRVAETWSTSVRRLAWHDLILDIALVDDATGTIIAREENMNVDVPAFAEEDNLVRLAQEPAIRQRIVQVIREWMDSAPEDGV